MPDAIRMMDLTSLSHGLKEFRHLDPEQRVLSHRLATQAAVRRVEDAHRDVPESERSAESRVHARQQDDGRRRGRGHGAPDPEPEEEREALPEQDEGKVLDILA